MVCGGTSSESKLFQGGKVHITTRQIDLWLQLGGRLLYFSCGPAFVPAKMMDDVPTVLPTRMHRDVFSEAAELIMHTGRVENNKESELSLQYERSSRFANPCPAVRKENYKGTHHAGSSSYSE